MTEKELSQFGLLEEFSITELEQRLEFEAWCNLFCSSTTNNQCTEPNSSCPPLNGLCGGGGGGGEELPNDVCDFEIQA